MRTCVTCGLPKGLDAFYKADGCRDGRRLSCIDCVRLARSVRREVAAVESVKPSTVDWFRVLWDLIQRGKNLATVERSTGISVSTLRGYQEGSHPPHWRGELLIGLWVRTCGRPRKDVPMVDLVLAPRVVHEEAQVVADPAAVKLLEQAWRV